MEVDEMDISRLSGPSGDLPIQRHFVPRRRLGPRPLLTPGFWLLAPPSGRRGFNMAGSAATFLHEPLFAKTG
jgi:hypothetical protein